MNFQCSQCQGNLYPGMTACPRCGWVFPQPAAPAYVLMPGHTYEAK